jgi:hypothetical protein
MRIDDQLWRDIVADSRRKGLPSVGGGGPVPADAGKVVDGPEGTRGGTGSGWVESPDIRGWQRGAGIAAVDALCQAQDLADKAAKVQQMLETAKNLRLLAEAEAAVKAEEKGK